MKRRRSTTRGHMRPPETVLLPGQRLYRPLEVVVGPGHAFLDFGRVGRQKVRIVLLDRRRATDSSFTRPWGGSGYDYGEFRDSQGGESYRAALAWVRWFNHVLIVVHYRDLEALAALGESA